MSHIQQLPSPRLQIGAGVNIKIRNLIIPAIPTRLTDDEGDAHSNNKRERREDKVIIDAERRASSVSSGLPHHARVEPKRHNEYAHCGQGSARCQNVARCGIHKPVGT